MLTAASARQGRRYKAHRSQLFRFLPQGVELVEGQVAQPQLAIGGEALDEAKPRGKFVA